MTNTKNEILDMIILLANHKNDKGKWGKTVNAGKHELYNCRYLLNQVLRNYRPCQYHISEKAFDMWNRLTSEDINQFVFDEIITCNKANGVHAMEYKGSEKEGNEIIINSGLKIKYNNIFHCEHVIPIKVLIEKIEHDPSYNNVEKVLSNIHICRMLKEEDRKINVKSNRPYDYDTIISTIYSQAGIVLKC